MLKRQRRSRVESGPIDAKALLRQLAARKVKKFGIVLNEQPNGTWELANFPGTPFKSKREAVHWFLAHTPRKYCGGKYALYQRDHRWELKARRVNSTSSVRDEVRVARWSMRPGRDDIAKAIRQDRRFDPRPSYTKPDTLGWRGWDWDGRNYCLKSPSQRTPWPEPEMRVERFDMGEAVRGVAGIHACRLPRGDWRKCRAPADLMGAQVLGLVERFGKAAVGEKGWRAEWVFIKELLAPDEVVARALRKAYPEIPVSVAHQGHWLQEN